MVLLCISLNILLDYHGKMTEMHQRDRSLNKNGNEEFYVY